MDHRVGLELTIPFGLGNRKIREIAKLRIAKLRNSTWNTHEIETLAWYVAWQALSVFCGGRPAQVRASSTRQYDLRNSL